MLTIRYETSFKKDIKRMKKRGYNLDLLKEVITLLISEHKLPEKYREHTLSGEFSDFTECHITPDWLLIYKIDHQVLILCLSRTGTHSDLF